MDKKHIFIFNHRKHNWPEVKRCVPIILIGTLILSALESTVEFMVDRMFSPNSDYLEILSILFGVLNAFLLRKYHHILRTNDSWKDNSRLAALSIPLVASTFYISVFMGMVHDIAADVYHARSLDGLTFNEAEYFYIDNPGKIDTTRLGHDEYRRENHSSRSFFTDIICTGYFVAPFCGHDSVFYAMSYSYGRIISPFDESEKEKEIWKNFEQLTEETRKGIKPVISNHLFHRIRPVSDSGFWTAAEYSYFPKGSSFWTAPEYNYFLEDSVSQDMKIIHRSVFLCPVEDDVMPHWFDSLPKLLGIFLIVSLLTSCVFVICDTSNPSRSSSRLGKKKKRRILLFFPHRK